MSVGFHFNFQGGFNMGKIDGGCGVPGPFFGGFALIIVLFILLIIIGCSCIGFC